MIKVSVMYPNGEGKTFDMAYYLEKHIPMARQKFGTALKGVGVEQGLAGGAPGSAPPYLALGHLTFDSLDAFLGAFAVHGQSLLADIPNYTNAQPTIQISEVII